jgi:hypothetical protein
MDVASTVWPNARLKMFVLVGSEQVFIQQRLGAQKVNGRNLHNAL